MITHIIPSMQLALSHVRLKDGLIVYGEVVNGGWTLARDGDKWKSKNTSGPVVHFWNVRPEDNEWVAVPKECGRTYEDAFSWLELHRENQKAIAAGLKGV